MTKETKVALAAIDALCKKRKAKALRKLVLAAVESERTPTIIPGIYTDSTISPFGSVATTHITSADGPNLPTGIYGDVTYTATGPA